MFAFLLGIENGMWKWKCLQCGEIFYGSPNDANGAFEKHDSEKHLDKEKDNGEQNVGCN